MSFSIGDIESAQAAAMQVHEPGHDREGYPECSCGWSSWTSDEPLLAHIFADVAERLRAGHQTP